MAWLSLALIAAALCAAPESRQLATTRAHSSAELHQALKAARPGTVIVLDPGVEYVGSFVLPPRTDAGSAFITIRTDGPGLPGPDTRTGPQFVAKLALLRSDTQEPALRTAPGTHHWRIENVAFGPSRTGDGDIIALGSGGRAQSDLASVPRDLILDRVYIRGDPLRGQRRGIALHSATTTIVRSYIADIKAVGVEAQAICGWNGPGPYTIENNYIEGAGENLMFGGADSSIRDLVPTGIIIRGNHFARPKEWRQPLLPAPGDVRVAAQGDGLLGPGTYRYQVVAERRAVGGTALSAAAPTTDVAIRGNGSVAIQWAAVPGADAYRVYRESSDGSQYWRVTDVRFVDSGADGASGKPPKNGSTWTVKNLLEFKNARQVVVERNLFEHHWAQAQAGYAIVITPRNQDGRAPWSAVGDIRFSKNVVRHVSAGINISGMDDVRGSQRTTDVVIEGNLLADIGGEWGGPGDFVQVGNGPVNVRIQNNTVLQTGRVLVVYGSKHGREVPGFVFQGNVIRHNQYGLFGESAGTGSAAIAAYFPGAIVTGNVFAGGKASAYPPGNRFERSDVLTSEGDAGKFADAGASLSEARTIEQAARDGRQPGTK